MGTYNASQKTKNLSKETIDKIEIIVDLVYDHMTLENVVFMKTFKGAFILRKQLIYYLVNLLVRHPMITNPYSQEYLSLEGVSKIVTKYKDLPSDFKGSVQYSHDKINDCLNSRDYQSKQITKMVLALRKKYNHAIIEYNNNYQHE